MKNINISSPLSTEDTIWITKFKLVFPVTFNLGKILEHIILDIGSAGLIPWLIFPVGGAFAATFLDLPNLSKPVNTRRFGYLALLGMVSTGTGIICLSFERYSSPALLTPSTYPHLLISFGVITVLTVILIYTLDLKKIKICL